MRPAVSRTGSIVKDEQVLRLVHPVPAAAAVQQQNSPERRSPDPFAVQRRLLGKDVRVKPPNGEAADR